MKRIGLFLLVLLIIVSMTSMISLTGCKEEAAPAEEEVEAEEEAVEEETAPVEEEITKEPITLNLWGLGGIENDWWMDIIELYQGEHPNVTIKYTAQTDLSTLVPSALASGAEEMDATFQGGGGIVDEYAKEGLLFNMDPYFEKYGWADKMPAGVNVYKTPEFGWAYFPTDWIILGLIYYNPVIFEEVGVEVPGSLDELIEVSEKIKAAGYIPWVLDGKESAYIGHLFSQIMPRFMSAEDVDKLVMWGRDPEKSAETAEIFKSQGAIDSLNFLIKIISEYGADGIASMDYMGAKNVFIDGKAALTADGHWAINITKDNAPDFEFDYFILPPREGNNEMVASFLNGWVVPAYVNEEKIPVIMDLFNSMLEKEYASKSFDHGLISTSLNVDPNELENAEPMLLSQIKDVNTYGSVDIIDAWTSPSRIKAYYDTMSLIAAGKLTAEEAAQSLFDAAIDELE